MSQKGILESLRRLREVPKDVLERVRRLANVRRRKKQEKIAEKRKERNQSNRERVLPAYRAKRKRRRKLAEASRRRNKPAKKR